MLKLKSKISTELIFGAVISILCLFIFLIPLGNGDELWNFNFARQIADGNLPYRDFNMVQTPLSAFISSVFIKILGDRLISYRVAGYFLIVAIFLLNFKICKKITGSDCISAVATMFSLAVIFGCFIYDYNYLSLLIVELILWFELRESLDKTRQRTGVAIGLLFGLLPIIKQSIGIVLFAVNFLICLTDFFKNKKFPLARLSASFVPGVIYTAYLIASNTFAEFFDYAVLGIKEFTHRQMFFEYMFSGVVEFFTTVAVIYLIFSSLYKFVKFKKFERVYIVFLLISISWFVMATYPLFDTVHVMVAILPIVITRILFVKKKIYTKKETVICSAVSVALALWSAIVMVNGVQDCVLSSIPKYDYIPVNEKLEYNIETVSGYIEDKEKKGINVLLANEASCMYTIPLNRYTKNWDMLLVGNIGSTTVEELLDFEDTTEILVLQDEYEPNKQSHFELIDYVKENYQKTGEVLYFDVYKK